MYTSIFDVCALGESVGDSGGSMGQRVSEWRKDDELGNTSRPPAIPIQMSTFIDNAYTPQHKSTSTSTNRLE